MRSISSSKISDANFRVIHVGAELLFTSLGIYLLTVWEIVMNVDDGRRPGVWHEDCATHCHAQANTRPITDEDRSALGQEIRAGALRQPPVPPTAAA
jgi:hypothetical protein